MTTDRTPPAPDYGSLNERGEHDGGDAVERARSVEEFRLRDKDGDGGLTAEEYVGKATGSQVARRLADFMKADKDGDGEVTLAEWHKLRGTASAGDQLLELAELIRKVDPASGEALRDALADLAPDALARVSERVDLTTTAAAAPGDRMAAIVKALRDALAHA